MKPLLRLCETVASNLTKKQSMKKEIDDTNFESIIDKVSIKSGLKPASIRNILTQNQDFYLADYLGVKPADIDCIFSSESSIKIADIFGLTYVEVQNLIDELGNGFIVGMLFSKIILDNE